MRWRRTIWREFLTCEHFCVDILLSKSLQDGQFDLLLQDGWRSLDSGVDQ